MKFDLCVGGGEIFLEFSDADDRDTVWEDLTASYGWQAEWAEKRGDRQIIINATAIPISYRWKCTFEH